MVQPKVFVIILNLRDTEGLVDCLTSLCRVSYANFDVILVHNGVRDVELERRVSPFSARLAGIIHTGENTGFSKGNNVGIRLAFQKGAEYVFLLNDDTVVSPDFLDILMTEAEKDPLAGMLGPEVLCYGDRERVSFSGAKFNPDAGIFSFPRSGELSQTQTGSFESDYVTGCAVLVKRKLIDKIGLLDERFFLYWEDSDWGLRAKKAGFRCLVVPAAKIWHKVSASSGGTDSAFKAYYKTRNKLVFADMYAAEAKNKILIGFARDIAWLFFKSREPGRFKKGIAYLSAVVDWYFDRTGRGPAWL